MYTIFCFLCAVSSELIDKTLNQGPLISIKINFNPSMEK